MKQPIANQNSSVSFNPFDGPVIEKVILTTQSQAEIWIACKLGGEDANRGYNESITLVLEGKLDLSALESAIQLLVKRHESLRSVFSADGRFMSIMEYTPLTIKQLDYSQQSSEEKKDAISNYILEDANYVFDLIKGPLFKVGLLKTNNLEHQLVITAHHIICDGWSLGIILEELGALYSSTVTSTVHSLPKVDDFSTYADELQVYNGSDDHIRTKTFWIDQYKNSIPELTLPTDFPRPQLRTYKSGHLNATI